MFGGVADARQKRTVHDARDRYAQKTFFLGILLPDIPEVSVVRQCGLVCAQDGCDADFPEKVGFCVGGPGDDFRQIAELIGPQNDFAAGVGPEVVVRIATDFCRIACAQLRD